MLSSNSRDCSALLVLTFTGAYQSHRSGKPSALLGWTMDLARADLITVGAAVSDGSASSGHRPLISAAGPDRASGLLLLIEIVRHKEFLHCALIVSESIHRPSSKTFSNSCVISRRAMSSTATPRLLASARTSL